VPTMRSCGCRNREGRPGVLPGWWQEDTPSYPESSDEEEEEEGEVIPPPLSPSRKTLPSFGDIISRQVGITVGVRQSKWNQTKTRPSAGLP
jgi:hypothetical protein